MHELYFTSADRGLDPGKSGYTVVGRTAGMGGELKQIATGLSSFTPRNDTAPNAFALEPVNCLHLIADGGIHVVSRIGACSPDYTRRSNYLAHHTLLAPREWERCPGGPAELLAIPNFFMQEWTGEPREFTPRALPALDVGRPTTAGVEAAGLDVGWSEALADRLRDRTVRETWLVYPLGMDMLAVLRSVLSHLTPEERWAATFTTYATSNFLGKTPAGRPLHARIKCVVSGDGYANEVLGKEGAFDLASRPAPPARRNIVPVAKPTTGVRARPTVGAAVPRTTIRTEPAVWSGGGDDIAGSLQGLPDASTHASARSSRSGRTDLAWSSPWFVLPSLLSILMTGVSIWAILGWSGTQQELSTTILDLEKSRKDLGKKGDELSEIQAKLAEQQKRARKAEGDLEKLRTDAPTTESAGNTSPTPAKEATTALPAPMASQQATQPTATATPADGGASKTANEQAAPGTLTSDLPAGGKTPPTAGPQHHNKPEVHKDAVKDAYKKSGKFSLISGLVTPLSKDAISVGGPGSKVLEARVDPSDGKWSLKINGKLACVFEQEKTSELTIRLVADPETKELLRHFSARVNMPRAPAEVLPLGDPLRFKLSVKPLRKRAENVEKRLNEQYELFPSDSAKDFHSALVLKGRDGGQLYHSIEFAPDSGLSFFHCWGRPPEHKPYIGLLDFKSGVGAMLAPTDKDPLVYEVKGVISVKNNAWRYSEVLIAELDKYKAAANKKPKATDAPDKKKQLEDLAEQARKDARQVEQEANAALDALNMFDRCPIRWKLCKPLDPADLSKGLDTENGLVIIDSLGDAMGAD